MKKVSLNLVQVLMIVVTISTIMLTYKSNVVSTFVSMKVPADVTNSSWMLVIMLILGIFGGLMYKTENVDK